MGISNTKKTSEDEQTEQLTTRRFSPLNEKRTEPFHLIWLDACAQDGSLDSLHTQALFREINHDDCFFFTQAEQFFLQIDELDRKHQKILVVISGSFAEELLPKLRSLDSIPVVIIFCVHSNRYNYLREKYAKVVQICTTYEPLQSSIRSELLSSKFNLSENQLIKYVRPLNSKNGIVNQSAYHSYISFIALLKQMPQTQQAKDNMLKTCRNYYRGDQKEQGRIDRFQTKYKSDQAIEWYCDDCFVYRLVNQAFRTEDIALWYAFRYYVVDLCQQMEKIHKEQNIQDPLTLYRGQPRMQTREFEYFQCNIGCLVSTNGFLSTSRNLNVARSFIGDGTDTSDSKAVLFMITADGSNLQSTIFVDIDQYRKRPHEAEVLFNIGSVFRIEDVFRHPELNIWTIKMTATSDGTDEINRDLHEKKKEVCQENINLIFGRLLMEMNEYSKAESYFRMLLQELPRSHQDVPLAYNYIGDLNIRSSNWNEALRNFNLAYATTKKFFSYDRSLVTVTLNNIANYYKAIGDDSQALQYYTKALQYNSDQSNSARIQINIAVIHANKQDYEKALSLAIEARDILQEIYPRSYDNVIYAQGILGHFHAQNQEYETAEHFFTAALEMSEKNLSIGHRLRVNCVKALTDLYKKQGRIQTANDFCQENLLLYEQYLPAHHISIAYLLMELEEFYEHDSPHKIDLLRRALRIFERSPHLEYAPMADCLLRLAEYYKWHHNYDSASKCYSRALEIHERIYPKDHSIIVRTRSLIDEGCSQT